MLYHFFNWLEQTHPIPGGGVFQYLTFRAVLAVMFALIISLLFGGKLIRILQRKLIGETIRSVGPETHKKKAGTPTMGGIIIVAAILIPSLLWANLTNVYVLLLLLATVWMGVIGFVDDYIKVFLKDKRGLKGKFKVFGQVGLGLIVGGVMLWHPDFRGAQGLMNQDKELRVNNLLTDLGFKDGDRLIAVDGKPVPLSGNEERLVPYSSYVVQHAGNGRDTIHIKPIDRPRVSRQIFGVGGPGFVTQTTVPFLKNTSFNYSWLAFWSDDPENPLAKVIYLLVVIFIITAVSNGVNITDGLDGLAAGTTAIVGICLGIFAYVSGNYTFSTYLNIAFIPLSGEIFIVCAALVGACIGFLWYNTHPAQVFMGDTGSLALGGAVGVLALLVKKELLLPLICGVFFVESLSVILQVGYFKYTKRKYGEGRRIFRMAPLHHHYELGGLHEAKIVTRFWIVTILLVVLAFATLKLR